MYKILLFCNAGMSTSMLVSKMQKYAKDNNIEASIEAFPESQMDKKIDGADAVLLGPQVRFLFDKAKKICGAKGVPVDVINAADYGMMNGEKVLKHAIQMSGK